MVDRMDATLEHRLEVIIALLFLLLTIEIYRLAGYFGVAFVLVATLITFGLGSKPSST